MVLSLQNELALAQSALWIGIVQTNPSDLIRLYKLMELGSACAFVRSTVAAGVTICVAPAAIAAESKQQAAKP